MIKKDEYLISVDDGGNFTMHAGPLNEEELLNIIKWGYNTEDYLIFPSEGDFDNVILSECENINEELAEIYINKELIYYKDISNAELLLWLSKTEKWEDFLKQNNEV